MSRPDTATQVENTAEAGDRSRQLGGAGMMVAALAVLALVWAWMRPDLFTLSITQGVLGLSLGAGIVLAYQFPIYIRHRTKLCVASIPLYLLAVLLPPALAGSAALAGVLLAELVMKNRRGNLAGDCALHAGRWSVVVVAGSAVAHLSMPGGGIFIRDALWAATGLLLWAGDILTLPLALAPLTGEKLPALVKTVVREGGLAEAAQYVVGLIGVLLATSQLWALPLIVIPAGLVYVAFRKEVDGDTYHLLESIADAVDLRTPHNAGHSQRVTELAGCLLEQLAMRGQEAAHIGVAARLHEIGKSSLTDEILLKEGALSPAELMLVEACPARAVEMLRGYPDLSRCLEMILHQHERWDGAGHPAKLAGPAIPFGARVIAIADSYDAMTSERSFRRALTPDRAASILRDGAGRQWDPELVKKFLAGIADRLEHPTPQAPAVLSESVPTVRTREVTA